MRKGSKRLVAGVAALACAGAVYAADRDVHVLKVLMPDGSIEHVRYTGDVAPRVMLVPAAAPAGDPFAEINRMFAAMDAQADAMMRQATTLAAQPAAANPTMTHTATNGSAPAGSYHYSYVSTSNGGAGGCTQSYQMTSYDGAQPPKVISQQTGDCKGVAPLIPTIAPESASVPKPPLTPTAAKPAPPAHPVKVSKDTHAI